MEQAGWKHIPVLIRQLCQERIEVGTQVLVAHALYNVLYRSCTLRNGLGWQVNAGKYEKKY